MKTNNRRKFIQDTFRATIAVAAGTSIIASSRQVLAKPYSNSRITDQAFQFVQVKLPYTYAALEPNIDALTMEIHYTKHHTAYIKNVNEAIAAEKLNYTSEKDFFDHASQLSAKARNNGGGAWNHNFFWESMKPGNNAGPEGKLKAAIIKSFGSLDKFKEEFSKAALTRFGSGWAWLVNDQGTLKIGSTPNQDNPLMDNAALKGTPLLGIDVWEHAYYLQYQNKRNDYIANWWNIVNWAEVAKRMA